MSLSILCWTLFSKCSKMCLQSVRHSLYSVFICFRFLSEETISRSFLTCWVRFLTSVLSYLFSFLSVLIFDSPCFFFWLTNKFSVSVSTRLSPGLKRILLSFISDWMSKSSTIFCGLETFILVYRSIMLWVESSSYAKTSMSEEPEICPSSL